MELSLQQAAARLGKTRRQVEYMIRTGRLEAKKSGGRWSIDSNDLPLSDGQQQSYERKQRQMRAAVEQALDIEPDATMRIRVYFWAIASAVPACRRAVNSTAR